MLSVPLTVPVMHVAICIRNDLLRYGVERMLQVIGGISKVECRPGPPMPVDVVTDHNDVTIVVLREIDDQARAGLQRIGELGAKILLLLDEHEFADLPHLSSVSVAGFMTVNELNASTLHDALVRMHSGEMSVSPLLTRNLMAMVHDSTPKVTSARPRMTPREQEVLMLLVEGLSNKQIARRLKVSEHGAKRLVANILAKMDCPNRTMAVAKALREGFYEEYAQSAVP
jgi:DNA-binding NarL/FixJ family response regulator